MSNYYPNVPDNIKTTGSGQDSPANDDVAVIPLLNEPDYYMHEGGHGPLLSDYEVFIRLMKMHFFWFPLISMTLA